MQRHALIFSMILWGCGDSKDTAPPPPSAPAEATQAVASEPDAAPPTTEPFRGCDGVPTLARIPEGPVVGEVDGRPFQARALVFEHSLAGWVLRIHDTPLAEATARVVGGQQIEIALPEEPTPAWKKERAAGVGGAYWTATKEQNVAARAGSEAWALELTAWSRRPWTPEGGVIQDVGRAAGRLAIALRGDGGHCAWVAGRFEGALIRQVGRTLPDGPVGPRGLDLKRGAEDARRDRAEFERKARIKQERAAQGYAP